jgi:hypothetical protein
VWVADLVRSIAARRRGVRVRKGDRIRARVDIQTLGLIYFHAPYTSGHRCRIPQGSVLRIYDASGRLGFLCTPDDSVLEEAIVPAADRLSEKYAGIAFSFGIGDIGRRFDVLDSA